MSKKSSTCCCSALLLILLVVCVAAIVLVSNRPRRQVSVAQLRRAAARYDEVIDAIEQYRIEQGQYPPDLATLVPDYLTEVPGIYVKGGERLEYLPLPSCGVPFTFYVYGHRYSGLRLLHDWEEWELRYCPRDLCDYYQSSRYCLQRINREWIWVYRQL